MPTANLYGFRAIFSTRFFLWFLIIMLWFACGNQRIREALCEKAENVRSKTKVLYRPDWQALRITGKGVK